MKTTRKLIPALLMLLVSAIMLSTASFAWFASNSTVTATGMKVKVESTSQFLQISLTTDDADFAKSVIIPDAPATELELTHAKIKADDPSDIKWYVGASDDLGSVGEIDEATDQKEFNDAFKAEHVYTQTFYVRMSDNSTSALKNFRLGGVSVSSPATENLAPAIRVLAVATSKDGSTTHGAQLWYNNGTETQTVNHDRANPDLIETIDLSEDYYVVNVYIYFDGEDSTAYSDNVGSIQDLTIDISFTAGPYPPTP